MLPNTWLSEAEAQLRPFIRRTPVEYDGMVIAGQGTLALEVLEELGNLGNLIQVVPVGGGGLVSGERAAFCTYSTRIEARGENRLFSVQTGRKIPLTIPFLQDTVEDIPGESA